MIIEIGATAEPSTWSPSISAYAPSISGVGKGVDCSSSMVEDCGRGVDCAAAILAEASSDKVKAVVFKNFMCCPVLCFTGLDALAEIVESGL